MDSLVLLSAVLLFAVICISMVGGVPAWPIALVVGLGATAVFAVLYRFLFLFWIGGTPGRLAGWHFSRKTMTESAERSRRPAAISIEGRPDLDVGPWIRFL